MDEDSDIFDMFQEIIASLEQKDPNGNMRMLSQNPRYGGLGTSGALPTRLF